MRTPDLLLYAYIYRLFTVISVAGSIPDGVTGILH